MSANLECSKVINSLISSAEATTGGNYKTLTEAHQALKNGYGQGGESKPEQEKTVDITENGTTEILPDEGKVLSKVTVNVETEESIKLVPLEIVLSEDGKTEEYYAQSNEAYSYVSATADIPKQEKTVDITENGTTEVLPDNGTLLSKVTVNVETEESKPEQEKTVDITENGTTEVIPDEGKTLSKVTVNVAVETESGDKPILGEVTDFSGFFQSNRRMEVFNKIDTKSATNMYQFCYQNSQITEPPIINTSNVVNMEEAFNECTNMKSLPNSGKDKDGNIIPLDTKNVENFRLAFRACRSMEGEVYLDTQNATSLYQTFTACHKITKITFTDTSKCNAWFATFNSCSALKTIENITMNATNNNTFVGCTSLENVTFIKVAIPEQNNVPILNITKLSRDSIYSLVNALEPNTGDVITIALGDCLSKLSSDEKNEVKNIATSKGFNLT